MWQFLMFTHIYFCEKVYQPKEMCMNIRKFSPYIKSTYNDMRNAARDMANPQKAIDEGRMVDLGWQKKRNGQIVNAQLPESALKIIPKLAKGIVYFMMAAFPVGTANSIIAELIAHSEAKAKVAENIVKAKATAMAKDSIVFDSKIPLPEKLYNATKNEKTNAGRFLKSMKDNKESLMKDLNITSEEYNEYAIMALKLSKEESQYGNAMSYKLYDAVEKHEAGRDAVSTARKITKGDGDLSLGMTRLKINKSTAEEKALMDKYGITSDGNNSNVLEPEKSSIATIIHLATLGKDYPKYLENAKALAPDLDSPMVQASIKNAQDILFNDVRRPKFVFMLQGGEQAVKENFADAGFIPVKVTEKDLNDLRTYASTVILSKEAYLAGRWNGRKLLPEGVRKDQACANLLNVAVQKGYISNINKKSSVIY